MKGFLRGVWGVVRSPCHKQVKIIGKNTEAAVFCFLKLFLRGFLLGLGLFCLSRRLPVLIGKPEVLCQLYGGFFLSQPIFDVGQSVVNSSAGVIIGNTSIDISSVITDMEAQLEALGTGELFGLWFQSLFVGLTMNALSICIMLVIYGRMIEVYLTTSVGPIPLATMANRDWSHTEQNYLKSLFALVFQEFPIMVCVGIYSVLVQSIATDGNISGAIWACMGYTVLLCFALFKTGSLSKSLFGAH